LKDFRNLGDKNGGEKMKRIIVLLVVAIFALPSLAWAAKKGNVDQYGDTDTLDPAVVEQVAPPAKKEAEKSAKSSPKFEVKEEEIEYTSVVSSDEPSAGGRAGKFRAGFVGPGIGVANNGVNAFATFGLEGEYFFFEKLSAGLRAELGTKFTNTAIVSFVPRVRYVFDFESYPRWAAYIQAGAGVAVIRTGGSTYTAADIAAPGVGAWWQWTDKWSVGVDSSLRLFVRSNTTVGFTFAPTIRYLF